MLFIQYPKCTTCQKAKKFLDNNKIKYIDRNIVTDNPTKEDLEKFIKIGNLDIKKLFNTSGMKYRELGLKEKLKTMSDDEKLEILATDGMLVKRPLLVGEDFVLTGFKQEQWADTLN
jgi:transcriptional regulator, spx/mgsR family